MSRAGHAIPEPTDAELQKQLEEQIVFFQELEEQFVVEHTVDSSGKTVVDKKIPIPVFPLETDNQRTVGLAQVPVIDISKLPEVTQSTADLVQGDNSAITQEEDSTISELQLPNDNSVGVISKQKPKQEPKSELTQEPTAQVSKEDIDIIGQLEKRKRVKWVVQVGAFSNEGNVNKLVQKLKKNTSNYEVFVQKRKVNGAELQVVFVGPVPNENEAIHRQKQIQKQFQVNAVVKTYKELGL